MDIVDRAYDFSVRVVELVRYLKENGEAFPLCDQLLDRAVAAGLAVRNGNNEQAARRIEEADYMIEMAQKSGYLTKRQVEPMRGEAKKLREELLKNKG